MKSVLSALMLSAAALSAAPAVAQDGATNIVLVHGAFADETSWDKVAEILSAKGYNVTQVANPLTSLADDVAATKAALDAQDGPTVLVGHSWGGVVIGEAGNDEKVKALVYVSAFAPDKGESLDHALVRRRAERRGQGDPSRRRGRPDLRPGQLPGAVRRRPAAAEAEAMAARQLPSNPANFDAEAEVAAWHDKPSFYVVTTEDLVIPADAQRFFAGRIGATVTEIAASHAGLVSKAEAVAKVIEAAAQ